MEQLNAVITKSEADAATLSKQIAELDTQISQWEAEQASNTAVRASEAEDYATLHKEYSETIDATERAVDTLKKQDVDRTQLLQLSSFILIPDEDKKSINLFLDAGEQSEMNLLTGSDQAPSANAYEFQSSGIVETLSKIGDKCDDQRTTIEKIESNAKHAFAMLIKDLKGSVSQATADRQAKAQQKAAKLTKAAEAKGDLADTTATRDSDTIYLEDLVATCAKKSADFENRQQLRQEELDAILKATEIMGSGSVSGAADKHLPALIQLKKTSFVQIFSDNRGTQSRVAAYLHEQGEKFGSKLLSMLATKVVEDPFVKVRKMIKDLIVRLMEEANEEAEHKGYCDQELATNKQTRNEKTAAVETLHAEIDALTASVAKGTQQIADLNKETAAVDAAVAEATSIREAEKAENTVTIKESQEASTAVNQAVQVLKDFYDKAGDATSLIQAPADAPEVFSNEPYTGMQSENGGVLGMLEVIATDFARLESDTKSAEAASQKAHDEFMFNSAENKAANNADVDHKTNKKTQEESTLTMKQEDLDGTQTELDAALAYYDKLKPSCVSEGVSFEDRVARRKEEVESLQEALRIFSGDDLAFLQK